MFDKIKKIAAGIAVAAAVVTGGAVADVATSHNTSQAEAVTWTQGPVKWQSDYRWDPYAKRYYCGVWAYNDYNWWEESWAGGSHRDGWEREWWALC
jgi:hypothetical protein